jgi:hypothetical protein
MDHPAVFTCLADDQDLLTVLGTPPIRTEKTIVSFLYEGQQDIVIIFMIARVLSTFHWRMNVSVT